MSKVSLLAFAVLLAGLGLSGCGGGGAEENVPGATVLDTTAPSVPTGLSATANSPVSVSWTASIDNVGVTGYRVYRDGTLVASPTSTSVTFTGLLPSTTYSFTVSAVDAAGNASAQSPPASVTTPPAPDTTAPSTPTGLTATAASSSQINLSWIAATDNIGVTGYNVYRGGMLVATLGAVTAFQNTGLNAFTTYSYTVQAVDAAGNVSPLSSSASATTQPVPDTTAPSTPAGLTATAVSASQINLSWTAATDNVGVTGYNVFRGAALIATLGAVTTFQNAGLTASTTYSYTVRALDAAGNISAPSSSASATTQAVATDTTPPSTPTGLSAAAVSSSQINLSWTAATDNVGVTGYNVLRDGVLIATVGAVTTFQNNGLAGSTTYTYTVRALDAAGNVSAPSTSASATTQAVPDTTAPSTPTGLSATAVSSSQINLAWTAATDNVGVTGYNVFRGGTLVATLGVVTTFQNTGLAASTTYTYTVRALDAAGNVSAPSSSASATTQAVPDTTAPSTPTGLSAAAVSSSQINLSWIAATDNVGVTGYNVYRGGTLVATLGVVTTFQNSGLTASTTYSYTVRAFDAAGNASSQSAAASATTQASSGAISLSLVPSRVSGVAPLAVFFDATGTTGTLTARPFHDLEYRWDFDDPASGATWSAGSRAGTSSKNSATGPVAAHVFESPGMYTVILTAFDGANTASTSVQITVTDPNQVFAGNTICIGATNLPVGGAGGCPAGASGLQQSGFSTAVSSSISAGFRRLLFKRGDAFSSTSPANIAVTGPGIIGAYGSGNAPIVNVTGNNAAFKLSNQDTPTIKDWRVMDLEIDGNSGSTSQGVYAEGGINQVTVLRLNIHHVHFAFQFAATILDYFNGNGNPGHTLWDQIAIVDCTASTIIGGGGGNGVYMSSQRLAILGNTITDITAAEHVIRLPHTYKGILSNNTQSNPASTKHTVKMHAATYGVSPTSFTEQIVLSDNKFTGGAGSAWIVAVGPQNDVSDERVRNVIVERNWFAPQADTQRPLVIWAQEVTARNNLFNLTGNLTHVGAEVSRRGVEPAPANASFYNNTFYSNSTDNFIPMIFSTGTGHVAKNNLGYAPNSTSRDMISGTATASNNTSDAGILVSPSFATATPSVPADFTLGSGSNALNQGAAVPVSSDFFRLSRPQNGGFDLGAMERP